ncbi:MAG: hypothetical protein HY047_02580 [Acidobacteria bacterium]|nr:hypothetical protein [Acidobacteriota bacterium]
MGTHLRWLTPAVVGGVLIASTQVRIQGQAPSQAPQGRPVPTEVSNTRFNAGQSVVPYFEGWIRNPDGSFDLVFGYFNRNWKEELAIPAGPDNKFEPGSADGGQPTYFLPRRQRWVVRYRVPADFGKKIVTWSITANGRTETAYGDLIPPEELTERVLMTNGNFNPGESDPNQPPSITLAPLQNVVAGVPVTLTASVQDDGLPKPRAVAPPPPPPTAGGRGVIAQVNSSGPGRPRGLRVSWMEYRGPGKVTFGASGPTLVMNGQASTSATFAVPGTYVLRATANDGQLSKFVDVTVTVKPAASTQGQ